jgi:hypothetical protein
MLSKTRCEINNSRVDLYFTKGSEEGRTLYWGKFKTNPELEFIYYIYENEGRYFQPEETPMELQTVIINALHFFM